MGLIQQAQQAQPMQQQAMPPEQQATPPEQGGDAGRQVMQMAQDILGKSKDMLLHRFGDGEGDVFDEIGEAAAQLSRSIIKTLAQQGTKLPPQHQADVLILVKDMLTDACEENGILKESAEVQNRRTAAVAAAKYFKRYNQMENKGGQQNGAN